MNCDRIQEKLSLYLEGGLEPSQESAVIDHLSSCAACLGEAERLKQTIRSVAELREVEPPPGFSEKVMARVRDEARRPGIWERIFFPLWTKIPIQAAALVLVAVFAAYLYEANQPVRDQATQVIPPPSVSITKEEELQESFEDVTPEGMDKIREQPAAEPLRKKGTDPGEISASQEKAAMPRARVAPDAGVLGRPPAAPSPPYPPAALDVPRMDFALVPSDEYRDPARLALELDRVMAASGAIREVPPPDQQAAGPSLASAYWLRIPPDRLEHFQTEIAFLGELIAEHAAVEPGRRKEITTLPSDQLKSFKPSDRMMAMEAAPPTPVYIRLIIQSPKNP